MDDSVDKELPGWLHLKGCCQWLNVQVEIHGKWISSGFGIGSGSLTSFSVT